MLASSLSISMAKGRIVGLSRFFTNQGNGESIILLKKLVILKK